MQGENVAGRHLAGKPRGVSPLQVGNSIKMLRQIVIRGFSVGNQSRIPA